MNFKNRSKKIPAIMLFLILTVTTGCFFLDGSSGGGDEEICTNGPETSATTNDDSSTSPRTFNAQDITDDTNLITYSVTAKLVYNGYYCKVYKDQNDKYINDSTAAAMGKEFDNNIYCKIVNSFGRPSDVDGNGKIILLVLDIKDGGNSNTYCAGYFYALNEFDPASHPDAKDSNNCDMIYMDSNPGATSAAYLQTFKETMAHEFQHLVNFNQKVFLQNSRTGFDTWIDEGMSSAAERIYSGSQIQDKIDYFNADKNYDIAKGQRFIAWSKGNYSSVLGNYSTVYLFFQWLNIQSQNDNSIYKIIMKGGVNNYDDYRAVYEAGSSLTSFTGSSFQEMLRDWNLANLLCRNTGLYGYKREISTTASYFNKSSDNNSYTQTRDMLPGECIYTKITADYTLTSKTNIAAAGVNTSTEQIDTAGTTYTGDVLLVYNTSATDSSTYSTTGNLPSPVASVSSTKSIRKTESETTRRYPVDAVLKMKDYSSFK